MSALSQEESEPQYVCVCVPLRVRGGPYFTASGCSFDKMPLPERERMKERKSERARKGWREGWPNVFGQPNITRTVFEHQKMVKNSKCPKKNKSVFNMLCSLFIPKVSKRT